MVNRPTVKHPQKAPKSPEFFDTDSDDENEPAIKHSQKAPKYPEFVDTDSDDSDDEKKTCCKTASKSTKNPRAPRR